MYLFETEHAKRERQQAERQYNEQRRRENFKKAAQPFIRSGKDFWTFAGSFAVKDGDQQLYEELKAEMKHQQDLDEAFLRGFMMDSNAPVQRQDNVRKVIG